MKAFFFFGGILFGKDWVVGVFRRVSLVSIVVSGGGGCGVFIFFKLGLWGVIC